MYSMRYYKEHWEQQQTTRRANFLRRYGITEERLQLLIAKQGNKCLICESLFTESARGGKHRPVIDHCHNTNVVRGILCNNCNTGIGFLGSIKALENALKYVKKNELFFQQDERKDCWPECPKCPSRKR